MLLLLMLLHGCAGKTPWTTPVDAGEASRFTALFQQMQQRDNACPSSLDAEATLIWDGPGENRNITGFLQFLPPAFLKFVILNPLGQPMYAVVSNGATFQSVHIINKLYTTGSLSTLASRYNVPGSLLSQHWGDWLTGRIEQEGISVETIHADISNRGVWVTVYYRNDPHLLKSHLLIDPSTQQLLSRVLISQQEETIATLTYQRSQDQTSCAIPESLTITDLPYNSQLTIKLGKILQDRNFTPSNFQMKIPAGFSIDEMP